MFGFIYGYVFFMVYDKVSLKKNVVFFGGECEIFWENGLVLEEVKV